MRQNWFVSVTFLVCAFTLCVAVSAQAKDDFSLTDEERFDIKKTCTKFYSGALEIIDYYKCISKREAEAIESKKASQRYEENQRRITQERIEANRLKTARMEASRGCVNSSLPSIETKIRGAKNLIKTWDSLGYVKNILDKHFVADGEIVTSSSNLAKKVYVLKVALPCDTDFHFLINVVEANSAGLESFSVWAKNPLDTYRIGNLPDGGFLDIFLEIFKRKGKTISSLLGQVK
jgi:hypothetical protein